MQPDNPLMGTKEVARILGIHYLTVMKHIKKGNIRHVRYGKLYKVSRAEVDRIQRDGLPLSTAEERINRVGPDTGRSVGDRSEEALQGGGVENFDGV